MIKLRMLCIKILTCISITYLSLIPLALFSINDILQEFSMMEVTNNTTIEYSHGNYNQDSAALCAIALDEEPYLQEWVDYNIGLGFDLVYIFDNSDTHDLQQWKQEQPPYVRVTHFPGISKQTEAYRQCAKTLLKEGKHKWVAFFDIDEFLVLRRHDSLLSFLKEFLISGALGINWIYMGSNKRLTYEPIPVSYRFHLRVGNHSNIHIKTIAVLKHIHINGKFHCHFLPLKPGYRTIDTNGRRVKGPFNRKGPEDIAALYHFFSKSTKEFILKRIRGRADTVKYDKSYYETLNASLKGWMVGDVIDYSVWITLKRNVPKYAFYEEMKNKVFKDTIPS